MEVKNLFFSYGKNRVLNDISFFVPEGKVTTFMGSNGCGKSTLFQLMTKNLTPNRGRIFLDDTNIRLMKLKEFARRVAIVHQYNTVQSDITVEKLISFGRTPYTKLMHGKNEEDEQLINWAIEETNLEEYREREVGTLSGGQKQRVWIAMALAQNTKILFLDEPTTYLDIRYQIEILKLIRKLNEKCGITIIMVLHDINQAIYYSDEIIGIKEGKVAVQGNPNEVITPEVIKLLYGVELEVKDIEGKKLVVTAAG